MKKILLVDDENIHHILGKRILKEHYELLSAYGGEEALTLMQSEVPDLVLMDLVMPAIDGFETFRRMKEDAHCKDIPVIFLTAKEDVETRKRCMEEGAAAYVTKPFSPPELVETIRRVTGET